MKIGLIGCGGRGTGAVLDALGAWRPRSFILPRATTPRTWPRGPGRAQEHQGRRPGRPVRRPAGALPEASSPSWASTLPGTAASPGSTPTSNCSDVPEINYVILATPPHFRPMHLKAAIEAGKNVFIEKPAAVDVPGVHMVIEAGELAKQEEPGHRRRHPAAAPEELHRDDQAHPGRRDRRHHLRQALLERRPDLGRRPPARLERHGVADPQLELLHLALRRPHRRAARPQPRRDELGARDAPDPRRLRPGRPPGAARRAARPHLRPLRRRVRVSRRDHLSSASAARSTAATTSSARPSSAPGDEQLRRPDRAQGGSGRGGTAGDAQPLPARSTRT